MKKQTISRIVITTFVSLYLLTSTISCIHVIDFFQLTNSFWLAVTLAIAFEIGAAASLASLVVLEKMNRGLVFALFILLTLMQAMGNSYYAYIHANNFQGWIELFGLADAELIQQKRILSIVSGAILPIIALGFIKSLVDYIKPEAQKDTNVIQPTEVPVVDQTIVNEQQETIEETPDVSIEEVKPIVKPTPVLINTPIVEQNVPIITKNEPINTQLNLFDDTKVNEPVITEEVKATEIQSIDPDIDSTISNNIPLKETVIDKLFKKIKLFK